MQKQGFIVGTGLALLTLSAGAALAQEQPGKDWKFTIGAFGAYAPDYAGSDDYEFGAIPTLEISYQDKIYLKNTELGWKLLDTEQLQAGVLARYKFGRDADDNAALRGLGDIDASVEVGGFMKYQTGPIDWSLALAQDVAGGHEGWVAEFGAGYNYMVSQQLMLFSKAAVEVLSQDAMQSQFGITAAQAAASGYNVHNVDLGVSQVGLSFGANYVITPAWHLTGIANAGRMVGDAADSPIVDQNGSVNQFSLLAGVSYHF